MEQRAVADHVDLLGESKTAVADHPVESLDGFEATIGERFVNERPQVFSRLQFRAVGWLKNEADAVGHDQVLWAVPAGIVELQHDALAGSGTDGLGKIGEDEFELVLSRAKPPEKPAVLVPSRKSSQAADHLDFRLALTREMVPNPPAFGVCESVPMTRSPGKTNFSSINWWQTPC